jgi:hypothetical protein
MAGAASAVGVGATNAAQSVVNALNAAIVQANVPNARSVQGQKAVSLAKAAVASAMGVDATNAALSAEIAHPVRMLLKTERLAQKLRCLTAKIVYKMKRQISIHSANRVSLVRAAKAGVVSVVAVAAMNEVASALNAPIFASSPMA